MNATRVLALVAACALSDAGGPDGIEVSTLIRDGRVCVSFALAEKALTDVEATIQAGLPTTLTYEVELRHPVSMWFDRTLGTAAVTATVQFDALTGRHQLSRSLDGRLEDSRVTEQRAEVRRYVASFERLPLFSVSALEPNTEYYVHVRVRTRPRVTWFFWPWDRGLASGRARFTFIP
jgi:hypothetical protein